MQAEPWEIWLAAVRFEDTNEVKQRPVVVVGSTVVIVFALKVTSHALRSGWGEYPLAHWQAAGLRYPSTVRIGKPLQIDHCDMVHRLGKLHNADVIEIQRIMSP